AVQNPATLPLDKLSDYIYEHHHRYLERITPTILGLLEKVSHRHGTQHPELKELKDLFQKSAGELAVHMKKEELILFPFIKNLVRAKTAHTKAGSKLFNTVKSPIQMMEDEHDHEGLMLKHMAELTNNFSIPAGACNSFSSLYKLMDEYSRDIHQHIHLENNVLFPGTVALETELQRPS
ncbi:MAG TPA: hemerythrin domain-containing protein, partial [Cyclobacteriaceae bacterium]